MKKILCILTGLILLPMYVYATESITAGSSKNNRNIRDYGEIQNSTITDADNGRTANITSVGNIYITDNYKSSGFTASQVLSDATPSLGSDCSVDTGDGVIAGVLFYSNTADDYVVGYDNTTNSGTVLFDIQGGANVAIYVPINTTYTTGLTVVHSAEGNLANIVWRSID